jgi:hypothetical protein
MTFDGWNDTRSSRKAVMTGLVPAIHVLLASIAEARHGRDKPGHDETC